MKRTSSSSLQFLAAAAGSPEATIMSSRPPYRGGRDQWRRGFSYRSSAAAGSEDRGRIVTGDSHFRSVQDSNRRFRPVERPNFANHNSFRPRPQPPFNPSPSLNHPPPFHAPPPFNPGQPLSPPPPFNQNQQFRPPQQFRLRTEKPPDYRNWEFAKPGPPADCGRFTILSYNILADYLAINHRSKLYFHIPRHMLEWEWRKRSIIFELGLWSADILCFQEVDRFQDLEEELKLRGYSGIWKMRTGDPVDGCAIFWRSSRFKLLHEEHIEFSKLGLRDNVAQICVFELLNQNNTKDMSAFATSLPGCNRVVICNIHVLYNPKRGEIKLGQIRVLLDRAHAISKLWDDAPVVLCGDFNCTPKSPLYNFILEQKLNLSDLPRDKVSGQSSAEIRPPRQFNPYFRAQCADNTNGASPLVNHREVSQSGQPVDVQEQSSPDSNTVNVPPIDSLSQVNSGPNISDSSSVSGKYGTKNSASSNVLINEMQLEVDGCKDPVCALNEALTVSHQGTVDDCKDEIISTDSASVIGTNESTTCPQNAGKFSVSGRKSGYELTTDSPHEENLIEREHGEKGDVAINVQSDSFSEHSRTNLHSEYGSMGSDRRNLSFLGANCSADGIVDPAPASASHPNISSPQLFHETPFASPAKVSTVESSENLSPLLVADDKCIHSTLSEVNVICESTNTDFMIDEKMENLSLSEPLETNGEDENFGEDSSQFLSELHNNNSSFSSDFSHDARSDFVQSNKSLRESAAISHSQQLHHPGDKVLGDDSPAVDSEPIDEVNFAYDPSAWSPMEIETATGDTDCTVMEHSLKLRSTYAEIEGCSGTRDPNGEPLVTSYNRCFSGTVDYIWRSEGLQTVRVLAPIPKHAMQWTQGFPTKKWGSDHIALVSELAFMKDATSQDEEAS